MCASLEDKTVDKTLHSIHTHTCSDELRNVQSIGQEKPACVR